MSPRALWTVVLTAVSGPVGSVGLGVALGRWGEAEQAGMATLAALVLGLMVGGGMLALVAFGLCVGLLVRSEVSRPVRALAVMVLGCAANFGVMMLGLVVVGRAGGPTTATVAVVGAASIAVLAAGALLALRAGSSPRVHPGVAA